MRRAQFILLCGCMLLMAGLSLMSNMPIAAQDKPTTTPPAPITDPVGMPPQFLANYYESWVTSPHANKEAEAFVHWDAEQKIATTCATCHSTSGYQDFLGADGSAVGTVELEAPVGGVINCDACHSPAAVSLQKVVFPSGAEVGNMGDSTRCIVCHSGRASTVQVDAALEKAGLLDDPNKVSADLRFVNIHYYAAAASLYGTEAKGGYEYEGKSYQMRFMHVEGYNTCASCHNSHTLEVKVEECSTCHEDVKTVEDLRNIRMQGSLSDYDGDGNIVEGIAAEIEGMQAELMKAMQLYAANVAKSPIVYSETAYPYFFVDTNSNGKLDDGEAIAENSYKSFTANLERAAYNYQMSIKDPGGFAHNAAYHLELLYDSIESLNAELGSSAMDLGDLVRNDPGHFDTTSEAFRHWDAEGEVPGTCAKCHTDGGLATFLKNNTNIAVEPSNSLACTTCHSQIPDFTLREVAEVTFPSGAKVSFGEDAAANLCLNCHQGRESTVSVNKAIASAGVGDDEISDKLSFRNVHYFAAGASMFGTEVKGAYEYEGKDYNGRFMHDDDAQTCTDCHDVHALTIDFESCLDCHDADTPEDIREKDTPDYDGDGDTDEGVAGEIQTMKDALLTQLQAYALKTTGSAIAYSSTAYPYWFIDTNGNGVADPDEMNNDNRFVAWTPNLLRAAYNYQFVSKDPGQFTHNAKYIAQVLYDSIESVGGAKAVADMERPEVETE
ncbi:MAG: hypothetical protein KF726_25450 [Anaerolineae bacterium]|nr:hypothetical protein [Anaerolineae bacterium]